LPALRLSSPPPPPFLLALSLPSSPSLGGPSSGALPAFLLDTSWGVLRVALSRGWFSPAPCVACLLPLSGALASPFSASLVWHGWVWVYVPYLGSLSVPPLGSRPLFPWVVGESHGTLLTPVFGSFLLSLASRVFWFVSTYDGSSPSSGGGWIIRGLGTHRGLGHLLVLPVVDSLCLPTACPSSSSLPPCLPLCPPY
jgi:hypothetical protein